MQSLLAQVIPSFVVPGLAVAGVAAVSVPIIIHILSKRPRRPEPWAAMKFLLAAYQRHRARTRLEQWLLLATRCLLVLLLGLALAGPVFSALGALGVMGGGPRTVVLVLDNSVTTQATAADGESRFERLKSQAEGLLDSLRGTDRVALVTVARPAEAVVSPAVAEVASVKRQVELVEAEAGAGQLGEALREAMGVLADSDAGRESSYVVLLSDFSSGAARVDEPLPSEVVELGQRATLLMSEPMEGVANQQVASLRPDRRLVVAEGADTPTNVTWTVGLRRFAEAEALGEASGVVRLELGEASPLRQEVSWEAGQREAEVRIDTPLDRDETGLLAARASLEPSAGQVDALAVDNERWSLVRARQELSVMVLGRRDVEAEEGFGPQQWLTTALAPVGDRLGWPIEVEQQDAATLSGDAEALADVDAVYVIRPDLLSEQAWEGLMAWVREGGLAWFAPPAEPTSALWPQRLSDGLGLGWAVDAEPQVHEEPLRLDTETGGDTPELGRLRADLADLLRPVEVYQRLVIDEASLGGGTDVLLAGSGGEPLLVGATTEDGRGRVLLLATAVDDDWTNLPTKPLFVPLVHEVLRAGIDRLQPEDAFEVGEQPIFSGRLAQSGRLRGPEGEDLLLVSAAELRGGQEEEATAQEEAEWEASAGVRPIRPLLQPGVWEGQSDAVVVNVEAEAADTRAVERSSLEGWLGEAGDWRVLDETAGVATLGAEAERADMSWPLLWAVAVLALVEMALARWVSHASNVRRSADIMSAGRARRAA